jgi:hypothetical protein
MQQSLRENIDDFCGTTLSGISVPNILSVPKAFSLLIVKEKQFTSLLSDTSHKFWTMVAYGVSLTNKTSFFFSL